MFCPNCSGLNAPDAGFCRACGAALPAASGFGGPRVYDSSDKTGMAIVSLVLGIVSLPGACIPCCGFPLSITALVLGILARRSSSRTMALIGIIFAIIGLLITIANFAYGFYLGATGPHPLVNPLRS